jgi:hypothetical protein
MSRSYSGWNPTDRSKIEELIIETILSNGNLTINEIRLYLKQNQKTPKRKTITLGSLKQFCQSLSKKGMLRKAGEINKRTMWTLADNFG